MLLIRPPRPSLLTQIELLNELAERVNQKPPVTAEHIVRLSAMLLEEDDPLPPGAFCRASLGYLTRKHDWFPSYGAILRDLTAWWEDNKPRPDPTDCISRDRWVSLLASNTSANPPVTPQRIADIVGMLILKEDIPPDAYCPRSAQYVLSKGKGWFPATVVIAGHLRTWWENNRPRAALAIEGPHNGLTQDQASWLAHHEDWCKRILAKTGRWSDRDIASELARADSLLKKQAFDAWLTLHPDKVHVPWEPPPDLLRIVFEAWHAPDAQTRKELTYDPRSTVPPVLALPAPDQQRPPDHQRPLGRRDVAFSGDRLQQLRARRAKP